MANPINEIVDVQISRETLALDEADFNTLMFVTDEQVFSERSRTYLDADDLVADGFSESGAAYRAALAFFSQSPRPSQMIVSIRKATVVQLDIADEDIKNFGTYSLTLTDTEGVVETASFTASGTAEDDLASARTAIIAGLLADIATETISGISENPTDSLEVTLNDRLLSVEGLVYNVTGGAYETWADHKAAPEAYDSKWYVMTAYTHEEADILTIAQLIESEYKLYATSSSNSENKVTIPEGQSAPANDTLGKLSELNYDRTVMIPKDDADDLFIEVAVCGKKLTSVPGATTWMYTTLNGQKADNLSTSESLIVRNKNGNTYENISGVNMLREGKVTSGEYIDVMRGADELRNRIQLEVFRELVVTANAGSKIALDDEGVASLVNIVDAELRRSVENDFIKGTIKVLDDAGRETTIPGYTVEASLVSSLPTNQRANRQSPDIKFAAVLAGAIHKVVIRGVLSV